MSICFKNLSKCFCFDSNIKNIPNILISIFNSVLQPQENEGNREINNGFYCYKVIYFIFSIKQNKMKSWAQNSAVINSVVLYLTVTPSKKAVVFLSDLCPPTEQLIKRFSFSVTIILCIGQIISPVAFYIFLYSLNIKIR